MEMGHEDVEYIGFMVWSLVHCLQNMIAEIPQPGSCITKNILVAAVNLDARRIGAIASDCGKREVVVGKAFEQEFFNLFIAVKTETARCLNHLKQLFSDHLR